MKHSTTPKRNVTVAGLRYARVPVTIMAVATTLAVSLANGASDLEENIDARGTATVSSTSSVSSTPTDTPVSEDTVIVPVVNYYQQTCPALYDLVAVNDKVSIIKEESLGQELDAKKMTHADGLNSLSESLRSAAQRINDVPSPEGLPGSSDMSAQTYQGAKKVVTDRANELALDIDPLSDQIREVGDTEALNVLVDQYRSIVDTSSPILAQSLNDMIAVAGPSTSATGVAVRGLPECAPVFAPSPQPLDSDVVESAADLHMRLTQSKNLVAQGSSTINDIAQSTQGLSFEEGKNVTVKAWQSRADSAQRALDLLLGWESPSTPSASEANALIGYNEVRDDAVGVYTSIRDAAQVSAQELSGATSLSELNDALTSASTSTWDTSVAEAKLTVRIARNAPVPTTATANEIEKRTADNPTP